MYVVFGLAGAPYFEPVMDHKPLVLMFLVDNLHPQQLRKT